MILIAFANNLWYHFCMKTAYKCTFAAALTGYVCQAIVNMFVPLLFVTFMAQFGIGASMISLLVTMNFGVQLCVDLLAAKIVDGIGYKFCAVTAHIFLAVGFVCLATLPFLMPPFVGLAVSLCIYAVGGGLLEVLVSPIVEALPTENKAGSMSFLHSFYCWGCLLVVGLSTVFFATAGIDHWRILALLWAIVPLLNGFFFLSVPVPEPEHENGGMTLKKALSAKYIWLLMLLMVCAGASEQAVSQWASAFAETGLGIDKTLGDLLGVCMFAFLMGTSRALYAKLSSRIDVTIAITCSGVLCVLSYLGMTLIPVPVVNLVFCGLCGLSVGVLWPGLFSTASRALPHGGTTMFALLALAGDIGCAVGPGVVGVVSEPAGELKWGILAAMVFPFVLSALSLFIIKRRPNRTLS